MSSSFRRGRGRGPMSRARGSRLRRWLLQGSCQAVRLVGRLVCQIGAERGGERDLAVDLDLRFVDRERRGAAGRVGR